MADTTTARTRGFPSPCQGTKPNGDPCKQNALPGKSYCLWHSDDPEDVAEVQRRSSKGGKTTTSIIAGKITAQRQELADLKEELRDLARNVRSGDVTAQVGSTLVQVYNVMLRTIEQDRKARELDEMEERLSELENKEEV